MIRTWHNRILTHTTRARAVRGQNGSAKKGAALLIFVIFFMFGSLALTLGIGRSVYADLVQYRVLSDTTSTFYAAESGVEDAIYRNRRSKNYASTENFTIGDASVSVTRTFSVDHYDFTITANAYDQYRRDFLRLTLGTGSSFSYGLQSDVGGILMSNSSSVIGNIYANGTVVGTGGGVGNLVTGSIVSAGPGGLVQGVHATGTVWSHTIDDSTIDGSAYYYATGTLTSSIVAGYEFPGAADQPTSSLPFDDAAINLFETEAEAGGVIASTSPECAGGTYTINSDTTIGPVKIECNLLIDKSSTNLTLAGPVWVAGNISTKSGPTISIDGSLSGRSLQLIADDPSDHTTGSQITLQNSANFYGAGANSYVMLISQNTDNQDGGSNYAIDSQQSAQGALLVYAAHGEVVIEQSGQYVAVTGRLIHLENSAQIVYEIGAINLKFPSGPSGGFIVDAWQEIE